MYNISDIWLALYQMTHDIHVKLNACSPRQKQHSIRKPHVQQKIRIVYNEEMVMC